MKKLLIIITVLLLILFGTVYFVFNAIKNKTPDTLLSKEIIEDECTDEYAAMQQDAISASNADSKVSPNATLTLQKYYKNCKHTGESEMEIPHDIVNMTREEVEKEYVDWKLNTFSAEQIILYKEVEGICDEHYFITEKNGYLAIYRIDENDNKTLKEITRISLEYLPEYDLQEVKAGIKVYGDEELNAILEDFE